MAEDAEWFHRSMPVASYSLHRRTGTARVVATGPTHVNPGFELSWIGGGAIEFVLGSKADRSVAATTGASVLLPPGLLNTPRVRASVIHQALIAPDLFEEAADALNARDGDVAEHVERSRRAARGRSAAHEARAHDQRRRTVRR